MPTSRSSRSAIGVDPVRRAVADAGVLRPVRRARRRSSTTLLLVAFLGVIVAARPRRDARSSASRRPAPGCCRSPSATSIAHYLTYLLIDGQRIVIAISDPFQRGWDLFGTAFHEPTGAWLPPGLVWTVQLAAVVGGHMLGAWGGHVVAALDAPPGLTRAALRAPADPAGGRHGRADDADPVVARSGDRRRAPADAAGVARRPGVTAATG